MHQSEDIAELAKALAAAQAVLEDPAKHKTAKAGSYSYKYADIADVLKAVRPVLSKNGLSVLQITTVDGETLLISTRLMHSSGQWIEGEYPVCRINGDHQKMGAAMTYARRYALTSLIGVAADEDTDGQGAAEPAGRRSSHSIKAKAAKGEGDEWGDFMATLEKTDTLAKLDSFERLLEQATFPNWPRPYVEGATEELEKKREEITARDAALQGQAAPLDRAEYARECLEIIDGATDITALKKWWDGEKPARTRYRFTQEDVDALKAKVLAKIQELGAPQADTVVAADHLADMAGG